MKAGMVLSVTAAAAAVARGDGSIACPPPPRPLSPPLSKEKLE